jgi:ABC-2 type transport system ATP-binding protein
MIGYLAEQPGLYERLSALDNVLFHGRLRGSRGDSSREEAMYLLKKYGLEGWERVGVQKFSKGMKQRLAIARTFFGNPPVLLLDEPTSGLDPDGSELVISSIFEAARKGAAVLMTTHNAYLARRVAGSVMLMKGGRLASSGSFDEVLRPYEKVRFKLLSPASALAIRASLPGYELQLRSQDVTDEFVVLVPEKAEVPSVIKAALDGGLRPLSIEPGEITYEKGGG